MCTAKLMVRWFFGLQGTILILMLAVRFMVISTMHSRLAAGALVFAYLPLHLSSPTVSLCLGGALVVAVSGVFSMAWWTTRLASATHNMWAVTGSVLCVAEGFGSLYVSRHTDISPCGIGLIAVGALGLFIFLRPEDLPNAASGARRRTPIFEDRTIIWTRHAVTALSFIAQIAAVALWGLWAHTHHLVRTPWLTWIAFVVLASVLTTIVHECGHCILAWCFQMVVVGFSAGPFQWAKRVGNWHLEFHPASLLTAGGAIAAVPTDPNQPRWEEIVMIVAGPIANLLIGVPAIWAVTHDSWSSYAQTWEFVAFTGSFCLIAALLNLLPFVSGDGAYSDGARILQIITHNPLDEYHRSVASIASTSITARRYRDLDVVAIEHAASLFPNEFRGLHLYLCACQVFQDAGLLPQAISALGSAVAIYDNFSIDLPGPLHTIFVIGQAYLNRDAVMARLWWDRMEAKKNDRSDVDYWLAKAALHWIEGNLKPAEEAWQRADTEARALPGFGSCNFDRFRCDLIRNALDTLPQPQKSTAALDAHTPAIAELKAVAVSFLPPTREAARSILPHFDAVAIAPSWLVLDPALDHAVDPFDRIFSLSASSPLPSTIASADPEPPAPSNLPAFTLVAVPPTMAVLSTALLPVFISTELELPSMATVLPPDGASPSMSAVSMAPAAGLASPATEASASRVLASFTRIPASSILASERSLNRISPSPKPSALPSKGLAPSLNAPAVPAAFARRPVRPVPAPPSNLYPERALDSTAATPEVMTPIFAFATVAPAALVAPTLPAVTLPTTAVLPASTRFDPLEFIRADAMKNPSI